MFPRFYIVAEQTSVKVMRACVCIIMRQKGKVEGVHAAKARIPDDN